MLPGLLVLLLSVVTAPQAIALTFEPLASSPSPSQSDRAVTDTTPSDLGLERAVLEGVNRLETVEHLDAGPEEIPEEILRTELILDGRSPLNGDLLSPEQYAILQQQLIQKQNGSLPVDAELQSLVFQLKLLNLLKTILPIF